jgi:UDP-2-acetamido-3-amino-2,3-dideoxy-glucuronate N-acetyltransferase
MSGFISPYVVIDRGVKLALSAKVFHFTVLRDNVEVGENSIIGHNVVIERDTKIGNNTTIQSQCHITAEATIGDNVFFGPGVVTMNEKNIANKGRTTPKIERMVIGNGVRIGAGAVLAPGVHIGENAFVQANSFVTKDIPAGEKWGVPNGKSRAVKIGMVPEEEWL